MSCMATITNKMLVKLFHEVIISLTRWLFREATTSFSILALSSPHHQKSCVALHGTNYGTAGCNHLGPFAPLVRVCFGDK
jgi:hypothetical protein